MAKKAVDFERTEKRESVEGPEGSNEKNLTLLYPSWLSSFNK